MTAITHKFPIRRFLTVLMTLATLGILGWMIYQNRESLLAIRWQVRPVPLLASFLVYALCIGVAAVNWGFMMRTFGSLAPWRIHLTTYYISLLMGRLPIPLGYVAGRLLFYDDETSKLTISFASAVELALIVLASAGASLIFWVQPGIFKDWKVSAALLLLCLIAVHPHLLNRLLALLRVQGVRQLRYLHTLAWLAVSGLVWILSGSVLFLLISSIYPLPVSRLTWVIGAWSLSNLAAIIMVFLPVGLGLRELALSALLSLFLPPGVSALIAILSRVLMTIFELILAGLAFLFRSLP